jgi:hypothetical protein
MDSYYEVLGILAFFGSFWLAVTIITVTALTYSYWRAVRTMDQGREIALEMLQRKMTAEEIERVLAMWSGNRRLAKRMLEQHAGKQAA